MNSTSAMQQNELSDGYKPVASGTAEPGFTVPSFSMPYKHRKWRQLRMPRKTPIDQRPYIEV
jgi:hypothetical protein